MSTPPKAPPSDAERKVLDLEDIGRRHQENLDGLRKQEAYLTSEIERHDAALVTANAYLASLRATAGAGATHEAKQAVINVELNRGLLAEQRDGLQPELAETPKLIAANKKAIAAAKAEAGS